MNPWKLLDVVGEAQEEYILQAIGTRNQKRPLSLSRRLLFAAVIGALLTLTACGAKRISGWFAAYFQMTQGESLSDSQIAYVESNTLPDIGQAVRETDDGYRIQIRSALTDGEVAYIAVEVQGPEGVCFENSQIRFAQEPKLYPQEQVPGLLLDLDGAAVRAMGNYLTVEDGDGLPNTAVIVFSVNPPTESQGGKPFQDSLRWRVEFDGLEQYLYSESGPLQERRPLSDGTWEFELSFQKTETREVQFVSAPVPVLTSDPYANAYDHENQILSFRLGSLTYHMELAEPEIRRKSQDVGDVTIVMTDGAQVTIPHPSAYSNRLPVPVDVEQAAYLLLRDGTRLYPLE